MGSLNQVAVLLDRRRTEGVLGIEGPPFGGKTTLAKQLAARHDFLMVSEHTLFDPLLEQLARAPWPANEQAILERQRQFLRVEARRSHMAITSKHGAVMDRTVISIIAHLHVRTHRLDPTQGVFDRFLEECAAEIDRGDIIVPATLVFLTANPNLVLTRARSATLSGDHRKTEPFLLRRTVLNALNEFYRNLGRQLRGHLGADQLEMVVPAIKRDAKRV